MKTAIHIAAGAALLMSAASAGAEVRFGVMNEAYPPFFTKDATGKWIGWEIELMDAVCAEMKETCSIVDMSWDGLIPALQTKKFDVIWSSMSITDERKKTIAFTDKYYNTPSKLIGAQGGKTGTTPEDVSGKTIGIQVSTIQTEYYKKHYASVASEKPTRRWMRPSRTSPSAVSTMCLVTSSRSQPFSRPTSVRGAARTRAT